MALDAEIYTAHYEALRARMTGPEAGGGAPDSPACGIALAVLLQDGLPGWLAAVEPVLSISPAVAVGVRSTAERTAGKPWLVCAVAPDVLPPAQRAEATLLLAALVLSTARPAHGDPCPSLVREGAS